MWGRVQAEFLRQPAPASSPQVVRNSGMPLGPTVHGCAMVSGWLGRRLARPPGVQWGHCIRGERFLWCVYGNVRLGGAEEKGSMNVRGESEK